MGLPVCRDVVLIEWKGAEGSVCLLESMQRGRAIRSMILRLGKRDHFI